MQKTTVGILGKLKKNGAADTTLLVHSYYVGRPSPCVVIENGVNLGLTGGYIDSLDQVFQIAVDKHPGYMVEERMTIEMETPEAVVTQNEELEAGYLAMRPLLQESMTSGLPQMLKFPDAWNSFAR